MKLMLVIYLPRDVEITLYSCRIGLEVDQPRWPNYLLPPTIELI